MNVHMKLSEILMDELPEEHPWKGNIKGLVEMLIANGVTFTKDTNVLTKADRIRAMSDEELAILLADEIPHGDCYGCELECETFEGDKFNCPCRNAFYRWLKQPAED